MRKHLARISGLFGRGIRQSSEPTVGQWPIGACCLPTNPGSPKTPARRLEIPNSKYTIPKRPLELSAADLIMKRIRVLGSQQNSREFLYEALHLVASGKVKVMAESYRLDEINRAYDRVAAGQVRFRAVIVNE
jgi:hypothetical protein